ncbi:hypothetical protein ES288_D02G003700v1 [Gossypium darwinii]|uniref:Zinc finger PHD-type domain-containing protein n=1 Tax=Gossypium darwinii TaxID=34276 RepID=A0A5D2D9T3_GOSDA|nr:hypothetical protein ES288_D02G003700v1 [Gossypium darwinii]
MEESNNYGHQHPLLLILNQDQLIHNQSGVTHCSRCGEEVSAPCFCCVEHCGFYLHKACADAPLELNHPFHPHHPLVLLQEPPSSYSGCVCDFCDEPCTNFIYHCSCALDFHIKCALLIFNIAENNLKELEHVALQDEELADENKCFGCWEPLAKYTHFSPDCGFNLHDKCAELPFKLNLECHREHPLVLQFNSERLSCKICCLVRTRRGFVYGCSPCEFVVHIECVSQSPLQVIKSTNHEHPFTLFNGHQHPLFLMLNQEQLMDNQRGVTDCWRCGEKVSAPCFCCAEHCGFYLHKVCAEAPLELNHPFHLNHPLLMQNAPYSSGMYICNFCNKSGHKSVYRCSSCELDFHIKCALFTFNIAENNLKELEHVSLQDEELEDDSKCFGCWEPLAKYTHFSPDCGFNLHDKCAELPFKLNLECHREHPLVLQFNSQRLSCKICRKSNQQALGFFYGCSPCEFVVHIECASQSPLQVIKSTSHEHPFTSFNGHQHPLFLMLNQEQLMDNQRGVTDCWRCGEKVSAPCFCCAEHCGFYLHKVCAEAPLELNHPFHLNHPLLMQNAPYSSGMYICNFCNKSGHKSVYRCSSCELDFHIKCALFTFNIAENNLKELQHVALQHPLIPTEKGDEKLKDVSKCFGCREPLANYTHFSPCRGFNLHEKCTEIPFKLNHVCHRKHPLVLQFNSERLSCKICCQVTRRRGFVYGCSPCKFVVHIECASQSPLQVIKSTNHEHPFTLSLRQVPFTCDGCGTEGNHVAYTCGTCNITIHKNCISLPRIIKSKWHDHRLLHTYFHHIEDFRVLNCLRCHDEVNTEHGSYYCSKCNGIFHVKCVMKDKDSYEIVENEDEIEMPIESSIIVIESNDAGEATKIKHFKHMHNLMLGPFVGGYENSCDGCMLPVSDPFYHCSECAFFLHKACAELPKMKNVWHHGCKEPLALISDKAFLLVMNVVDVRKKYVFDAAFCCKDCNFVLDLDCFSLPITARHKCDEHLLSLTDHDDNSYSEHHHCDICEESRDPSRWFYNCSTCDTSAHVYCVLGPYQFLKLRSLYKENAHPDPLTIVKKKYYYPDCEKCGKPCVDVALECSKSECKYIVHWNCVVHLWSLWDLLKW